MPKRLGIIVWDMAGHGVARVISGLIPVFEKMGCHVYLLTDAEKNENDFKTGQEVVRVCIGGRFDGDRSCRLSDAIKKNGIDLVIDHEYCMEPSRLKADMDAVHSCGVKFVIHHHNVFTSGLVAFERRRRFTKWLPIYKMADALIALSRVDAAFFNSIGCRAFFIQNPAEAASICQDTHVRTPSNRIIWIGRLTEIKRPEEAIEIVRLVRKEIPDATLSILGDYSSDYGRRLQQHVLWDPDLAEAVKFEGYHTNVGDYLAESDVFLNTSSFEGWSCVIVEAKSMGVPVVCYDMPYIDTLRGGGAVTVPQMDRQAAAGAIVRLLSDKDHLQLMKLGARRSFEGMHAYDHEKRYLQFFKLLEADEFIPEQSTADDCQMALQTMTEHVCLAVDDLMSLGYAKKMFSKYAGIIVKKPCAALRAVVGGFLK